jgi:hypothetical protein
VAPELSNIVVDLEYVVLVFGQQFIQPCTQSIGLPDIASVTDQFDATSTTVTGL